jgi:hypothetical protein
MKSRCSFILKAGLALVLCFILLVGTMTVGLAAIRDELASTGWDHLDRDYMHISFNNGATWQDLYINSAGYIDFELKEDTFCRWMFYCEYGDGKICYRHKQNDTGATWPDCKTMGDTTTFYAKKSSDEGGEGNEEYQITLPAGHYVVKYGTPESTQFSYQFYRKEFSLLGTINDDTWSTTSRNMTYDGTNYYYDIYGDDQTKYFYAKIENSNWCAWAGNYNLYNEEYDGSTSAKKYGMNQNNNNNFSFVPDKGYTYRVWISPTKNDSDQYPIWVTRFVKNEFYLTGWLAGAENKTKDYKFQATDTDGVYTLTTSFGGSEGGYQYLNVSDGANSYYPAVDHDVSGGVASTTLSQAMNAGYKWEIPLIKNAVATFTWDFNDKKLYWSYDYDYYIAGYLNGGDVGEVYYDRGFSKAADNIYTLAYKFTSADTDAYLDVVKYDGTVYSLSADSAVSGTHATTTGTTITGSDVKKWHISGSGTDTYYLTWVTGATTADCSLSWKKADNLVYVKDGAAPSTPTDSYYNYSHIADSVISQVDDMNPPNGISTVALNGTDSKYQKVYLGENTKIKVTTTIADAYKDAYYVKAFNVNGVSYNIINASDANGSGVYNFTFTIPAGATGKTYEITPVYYLIHSNDGTGSSIETVTFYLEGYSDVASDWGDTPYAYPYYGNYASTANSFGVYPGQPFVFENGKYSIEIPIKNITIDTAVRVTTATGAVTTDTGEGTAAAYNTMYVKGVTVNNGYDDTVHNTINGWGSDSSKHRQTYDSDAFYKIYNEQLEYNESTGLYEKPNYIVMRIKPESKAINRDTYGTAINDDDGDGNDTNQTWGYSTTTPPTTLAQEAVTNIESTGNGWELYTDRYGRPIDIFGNVIGNSYSETTETNSSALRVISTAYSSNIAGDYATAWIVYAPAAAASSETAPGSGIFVPADGYTLVKDDDNHRYGILPSILAITNEDHLDDEGTIYPAISERTVDSSVVYSDNVSKYKNIYTALKAYKNRYVYISYEKSAQKNFGGGTGVSGAVRYDTRWYYSFAGDKISSNIEIEYWTGKAYAAETAYITGDAGTAGSTNQGSFSGCRAYYTNSNLVTSAGVTKDVNGLMSTGDILITSPDFTFTAVEGSGYTFKGWYLKNSDGDYTLIGNSLTGTTESSSNDTIVARFMKNADGTLPITHGLTSTSDGSSTTVTVEAKVYDNSDVLKATYTNSGTGSSIVTIPNDYIKNNYSDYYIDVTLTTTPAEFRRFRGFGYDALNIDENVTATETLAATATSTFCISIGDLFEDSTQTVLSLAYTSYVTPTPRANYIYNYRDRENNSKTLTVEGGYLTKSEYNLGTTPTVNYTLSDRKTDVNSVMASKISVFMKTNSVTTTSVSGTTLTVNANTSDDTSTLTYYYPKSAGSTSIEATGLDGVYYCIGNNATIGSLPGTYGTRANLASIVKPNCLSGKVFYAWYEYDVTNDTLGSMISTEENFNYAVTRDRTVIATYADSAYNAEDTWNAYIDEHELSKEQTNDGGYYYNNVLVRFSNYKTKAEISSLEDVEYGVLLIYKTTDMIGAGRTLEQVATDADTLKKYAKALSNNQTGNSNSYKIRAVKLDGNNISNQNRAYIAYKTPYDTFYGYKYAAVSFLKIGTGESTQVYLSAPVYGDYD